MDEFRLYERPVRVIEGIHWVGAFRGEVLQCNPYLLHHRGRAVLIDPGSRSDFATVMMKTMQAGIDPRQIVALIYQHYDPDLCGSMPNLIEAIANPSLQVLTSHPNTAFLGFYGSPRHRERIKGFDPDTFTFDLGGRRLRFIATPYCHAPGSFVTYDEHTRTLFSSDLFGSYSQTTNLFEEFADDCATCPNPRRCPKKKVCPFPGILEFHRLVIPSGKALRQAMARLKPLYLERIAPQHGFILGSRRDIDLVIARLEALEGVGIDGLAQAAPPEAARTPARSPSRSPSRTVRRPRRP